MGENIGEIVFFLEGAIFFWQCVKCQMVFFSIHRETLSCQGGLRWKRRRDVVPRVTTKVSRLSGAPGTPANCCVCIPGMLGCEKNQALPASITHTCCTPPQTTPPSPSPFSQVQSSTWSPALTRSRWSVYWLRWAACGHSAPRSWPPSSPPLLWPS